MPAVARTPPGTFGLRILAVSEVARAVKDAVRAANAPAPATSDDDRGHHEPDRRRLARRRSRPRPALAARPGAPRRVPGPGRGGAGEHRVGLPPPRTLDRPVRRRRSLGRRPP